MASGTGYGGGDGSAFSGIQVGLRCCAVSLLKPSAGGRWNTNRSFAHRDSPAALQEGPALRCVLVCTHETFAKGRSIFSRSTENGPSFP